MIRATNDTHQTTNNAHCNPARCHGQTKNDTINATARDNSINGSKQPMRLPQYRQRPHVDSQLINGIKSRKPSWRPQLKQRERSCCFLPFRSGDNFLYSALLYDSPAFLSATSWRARSRQTCAPAKLPSTSPNTPHTIAIDITIIRLV